MLNINGNYEQNLFLNKHPNKKLIRLTEKQLQFLIESDLITTSEKLEIVELSLGLRFLTEAESSIKYQNQKRKDGFKYPTHTLKKLNDFLNIELPFPTNISKRKSLRNENYIHVINIFANKAIKEYFEKFEKRISPLEIGILYDYHTKAVLAFCGYIESCPPFKPTSAYQYYNSKIYPKDFIEEVDVYHKSKWEKIKNYCPQIIEIAEAEFKEKGI